MNRRQFLQITSYPPPRAGWGVRVQFLKQHLEAQGHRCIVLNIGTSRHIPSQEYETVLGALDYLRKVWRYSREGCVAHVHVNGASPKGFVLTLIAEIVNACWGKRCFLTFHAGVEQVYFPRRKAPSLAPVYWLMFAIPRRVICNSEDVKKLIVEYGVSADKVVPIPAFSRQYLDFQPATLPESLTAFYQRVEVVLFCYLRLRPLFYPEALVEGFARLAARRRDTGLVLCGLAGHSEGDLLGRVKKLIAEHGLEERICLVDDLDHEQFLTALSRSALYVRTHTSDGVCSSVMEAMSLGIPVVASENGTRPPGVRTYPAPDPGQLAQVLGDVIEHRHEIAAAMPRPPVHDTVTEEVALLTSDE